MVIPNNNNQTPPQLAIYLNHSEVLDAMNSITKKPMPPSRPTVYKCLDGMMVARWEPPMVQEGVPMTMMYEVEVIKEKGQHEVLTSTATDCSKLIMMIRMIFNNNNHHLNYY